jgi:tRNA U34 5-methylaminomethyl-2-thiouridine-forming methyltransferase MnmC
MEELQSDRTSECNRCLRIEFGKGGAKERLALRTTTHRLQRSDNFGECTHVWFICNIWNDVDQDKKPRSD